MFYFGHYMIMILRSGHDLQHVQILTPE